MWKAIVGFFRALDHILTTVEDYFDNRFKTGQWVGDVKDISQDTKKNSSALTHRAGRSRPVKVLHLSLLHLWNEMLRVPAIDRGANLFIDAYFILKKTYIETIIILQLSFLSVVILFNLFINAPLLFFISFFPILFFNNILFSTWYYIIREQKLGTKLPMKEALHLSLQASTNLSILNVVYVITNLVFIAAFFIIASFYSYFFNSIRISWENAFAYWVIITPMFFLLLAIVFGLSIVACQTYFIILFEGKNIFYAFRKSFSLYKAYFTWFTFFHLFFVLTFLHVSYWISLIFFPLGFIASLFFIIQLFIFLGFLLRREFTHSHIVSADYISLENKTLLTFFMIFGFITYVAVGVLSIKDHNTIIENIDQTQKRFMISQQLKSFTNNKYGYTIDYPQGWTIHEEKDNSVTIYNNLTQTTIGGIFVNIKALPFSESDFNKLYNARSGLNAYNTLDRNITTKIDNLFVDYKYPSVKYAYLKSGKPLNEYSINYLVHRDDLMYVISFITYDRNIQGENLYLFDTMINSFRFTY